MAKIHGAASASEQVSGNINFYTIYVKDLDITHTGDILDQTQQNLDDIVNIVSAVEHSGVFHRSGDNVAILKELIHGTTIDSVALSTANVEFVMSDIL